MILTKSLLFSATLTASVTGGQIAMHKAKALQSVMHDLRSFTTPAGLQAPDADARLAGIHDRLQKIGKTANAHVATQRQPGCPEGLAPNDLRCGGSL